MVGRLGRLRGQFADIGGIQNIQRRHRPVQAIGRGPDALLRSRRVEAIIRLGMFAGWLEGPDNAAGPCVRHEGGEIDRPARDPAAHERPQQETQRPRHPSRLQRRICHACEDVRHEGVESLDEIGCEWGVGSCRHSAHMPRPNKDLNPEYS
jgi:hypothetical protein